MAPVNNSFATTMTVSSFIPSRVTVPPQQKDLSLAPSTWFIAAECVDMNRPSYTKRETISDMIMSLTMWYAKGAVFDAYKTIQEDLIDHIDIRRDYLLMGQRVERPHHVDCYMVGRKPKYARPCIGLSHRSREFCERAAGSIKQTTWWQQFVRQYPGFRLMQLCNDPQSRRLGSKNGLSMVYTQSTTKSIYNAPQYCLSGVNEPSKPRSSKPFESTSIEPSKTWSNEPLEPCAVVLLPYGGGVRFEVKDAYCDTELNVCVMTRSLFNKHRKMFRRQRVNPVSPSIVIDAYGQEIGLGEDAFKVWLKSTASQVSKNVLLRLTEGSLRGNTELVLSKHFEASHKMPPAAKSSADYSPTAHASAAPYSSAGKSSNNYPSVGDSPLVTSSKAILHRSTIGGVVLLNGKTYGLTVCHWLHALASDTEPTGFGSLNQDPLHTNIMFNFLDDNDSDSYRSLPGEDSSMDEGSSGDDEQYSQVEVFPEGGNDLMTQKPALRADLVALGSVGFQSSGLPDDDVDWALIELDDEWLKSSRTHELEDCHRALTYLKISSDQPPQNVCIVHSRKTKTGYQHQHEEKLRGQLAPHFSFIRLPGASRSIKATQVIFRELVFEIGDCGMWVFDDERHVLLGHIVAGHPGSSLAYMASIADITLSIKEHTGYEISLPDISSNVTVDRVAALYGAIKDGASEVVRKLIDGGVNVSTSHPRYVGVPLLEAIKARNLEIVKILLHAGAEINPSSASKNTPLSVSIIAGQSEIVKTLLDHGADINANPGALSAAVSGPSNMIKTLLDAGVDIIANPGALSAVESGSSKMIKTLLDAGADVNQLDEYGRTALSTSVRSGRSDIVKTLLDAGADMSQLDEDGRTALTASMIYGRSDMVNILLNAGADVNQLDEYGRTALTISVIGGRSDMVNILLNAGADVNQLDGIGETPLIISLKWVLPNPKQTEIVKLLLKAGADVNMVSENTKYTASQAAVEGGDSEIVAMLIDAGADINAKLGRKQQTMLEMAKEEENQKLIQLIEDARKAEAKRRALIEETAHKSNPSSRLLKTEDS